jgi:hypothetical protein
MLGDDLAEAQTFIQFAHQKEATIRRDARSLEIDLQGGIEGKLKWPVFFLTHWVLTSGAS